VGRAVTYVYCVVRSDRRPVLRRVPSGVPGASHARALDAGGGLWVIAADVPDSKYGEAAIARGLKNLDWVSARAVGHEAVVEHFLRARAVLPMQLFTIFTADERAVEHVRRDRRRITRLVERIEGHLEWGLRVTWDEQAARASVEKAHRPGRRESAASGVQYLARKRDMLEVDRKTLAEAQAVASQLYRELSAHATDAQRRTSTEQQSAPRSRLLLDAAYLVPAGRAAAFRRALRQRARKLSAPGVVVSLTGPWPPYNFIRQ
jgi:hypothetical protein